MPPGPDEADSFTDADDGAICSMPETVNVPSVADILCSPTDAFAGTPTSAENAPDSEETRLNGTVSTGVPSNMTEMLFFGVSPEPDMVTEVPFPTLSTFTISGIMLIWSVVTVKVASAEFTLSLTVMLWLMAASGGMVMVAVKVPDSVVLACATGAESRRIDANVLLVKPDPIRVTVEPAGPLDGDNARAGMALASSTWITAKPMQRTTDSMENF
jgi:hypothetical protein